MFVQDHINALLRGSKMDNDTNWGRIAATFISNMELIGTKKNVPFWLWDTGLKRGFMSSISYQAISGNPNQ